MGKILTLNPEVLTKLINSTEFEVVKFDPDMEFVVGEKYLVLGDEFFSVLRNKVHLGLRSEGFFEAKNMDYLQTRDGVYFKFAYVDHEVNSSFIDKSKYDALTKSINELKRAYKDYSLTTGVSKGGRRWYRSTYSDIKGLTKDQLQFLSGVNTYFNHEVPTVRHKIIRTIVDINNSFDYFMNKSPELNGKRRFGFDYETGGGMPFDSRDFHVMGFGISDHTGISAYYDYEYMHVHDKSAEELVLKRLREFCDTYCEEMYTANMNFEQRVTYLLLNKLYSFSECFTINILDGLVSRNYSLKYTAMKHLNVASWDDDFDYLGDKLNIIMNGDTSNNIEPRTKEDYKESDLWKSIMKDDFYREYESEFDRLLMTYWGDRFSVTPSGILGRYCCHDCLYTLLLRSRATELGYSDEAWDMYNNNMRLGSLLQLHGAYIDTEYRDMLKSTSNTLVSRGNVEISIWYIDRVLREYPTVDIPDTLLKILSLGVDFKDSKSLYKLFFDSSKPNGLDKESMDKSLGITISNVMYNLAEANGGLTDSSFRARKFFASVDEVLTDHLSISDTLTGFNIELEGDSYDFDGISYKDLLYITGLKSKRITLVELSKCIDINKPTATYTIPDGTIYDFDKVSELCGSVVSLGSAEDSDEVKLILFHYNVNNALGIAMKGDSQDGILIDDIHYTDQDIIELRKDPINEEKLNKNANYKLIKRLLEVTDLIIKENSDLLENIHVGDDNLINYRGEFVKVTRELPETYVEDKEVKVKPCDLETVYKDIPYEVIDETVVRGRMKICTHREMVRMNKVVEYEFVKTYPSAMVELRNIINKYNRSGDKYTLINRLIEGDYFTKVAEIDDKKIDIDSVFEKYIKVRKGTTYEALLHDGLIDNPKDESLQFIDIYKLIDRKAVTKYTYKDKLIIEFCDFLKNGDLHDWYGFNYLRDNIIVESDPVVRNNTLSLFDEIDSSKDTIRSLTKFEVSKLLTKKYGKITTTYLDGQFTKYNRLCNSKDDADIISTERRFTDETVDNPEEYTMKMYSPMNVCQKKSKRWAGATHTIPSRSEVKRCVISPPGFLMSYFDISGAEVRAIAYLSKDEYMLDCYEKNIDPYINMAERFEPGHDSKYYKFNRGKYKRLLLGSMYGMGIERIAINLGISIEEATDSYNKMFTLMSGVKRMIDQKGEFCESHHGYCESIMGDKLDLRDEDPSRYRRLGINQVIQNIAACSLADGFHNVNYQSYMNPNGPKVRVWNTVHDSSQNYFSIEHFFLMGEYYTETLTNYLNRKYGIIYKFDIEVGLNYYDMCTYKNPVSEDGRIDTSKVILSGDYTSLNGVITRLNTSKSLKYTIDSVIKDDVELGSIDNPEFKKIGYGTYLHNAYNMQGDWRGAARFDLDKSYYKIKLSAQ